MPEMPTDGLMARLDDLLHGEGWDVEDTFLQDGNLCIICGPRGEE